jgi:Gram-negative bacterial TonB protein C-terminal
MANLYPFQRRRSLARDNPIIAVFERGEEGNTLIELSTVNRGLISDVRLIRGSGYTDLDTKALAIMKAKVGLWVASPESTQTALIRWKLPSQPIRWKLPSQPNSDLETFEIHAPMIHVVP